MALVVVQLGVPGLGDLLVLVHRRRLHLHLADGRTTASQPVECLRAVRRPRDARRACTCPGWPTTIAPYDFRVNAADAAADAGCSPTSGCWCCWSGCSAPRPGILPPLALYLFCVISRPGRDLVGRRRQPAPAADRAVLGARRARRATCGPRRLRHAAGQRWPGSLVGLLFYEKTILVLGAIGIVAAGLLRDRRALRTGCASVWQRYRPAPLALRRVWASPTWSSTRARR